jgi:hypothetical protein
MRQQGGRGPDKSVTLPPVLGDCPTNHLALPEMGVQVMNVVVVVVAVPALLGCIVSFRVLGPSGGAAMAFVVLVPCADKALSTLARAVDMRGPATRGNMPEFAAEVATGVEWPALLCPPLPLHVACAGILLQLCGPPGPFLTVSCLIFDLCCGLGSPFSGQPLLFRFWGLCIAVLDVYLTQGS